MQHKLIITFISLVAIAAMFLVANITGVYSPVEGEARNLTQDICAHPLSGPRSLVDASAEEVGQYAIDYTCAQYTIIGRSLSVRLTRSVTPDDLASLGLVRPGGITHEPLMLVILQGDFEIRDLGVGSGISSTRSVSYIAYIVYLLTGGMLTEIFSRDGSHLRIALGDPSLPTLAIATPVPGMPTVVAPSLPIPTILPSQPRLDFPTSAPIIFPPRKPLPVLPVETPTSLPSPVR